MNTIVEGVRFEVVEAPAVAGTTDLESDAVDAANYECVAFVASMGAITAGAATSLKVQEATAATGATWADLEGAEVTIGDGDDNKLAIVEVHRPLKRYLRAVLDRGTQDSVCNGIIALKAKARKEPVVQPSADVAVSKIVVSPPPE